MKKKVAVKASWVAVLVLMTSPVGAHTLADALTQGTVTFSLRPRYESVEQVGAQAANAFTVRSLLGYKTDSYHGIRGMLQLINVAGVVNDYNSLINGKTAYAVVPDPEATDVNQAYISYHVAGDTRMRAGRQIIVLNNARFVGNVDFRQNMQTFDAFTVENTYFHDWKIFGAYSWRIKNVLNQPVPVRVGLVNATYAFAPHSTATVYSYTYENRALTAIPGAALCAVPGDPGICNSETAGARVSGRMRVTRFTRILYTGDYAHQWSVGGGSARVNASYYHVGGGAAVDRSFIRADYAVMGSNNQGTYGFQTPLASNDLFNGWAEVFLVTPVLGLRTDSITAGTVLARAHLTAYYYDFHSSYGDVHYGHEWDLSIIYPLRRQVIAGIQYADYTADQYAVNTKAAWVFVAYHYKS